MIKKPTKASEVLSNMIELLTPEGAWIKGEYARDKNGERAHSLDNRACKFCVIGAHRRAGGDKPLSSRTGKRARSYIMDLIPGWGSVLGWNDDPKTTKEEVMRVLTTARERAAANKD